MKFSVRILREVVANLLREAVCPGCGTPDAYIGVHDVECPNSGCRFFTQKQLDNVKALDPMEEPMPCPGCGFVYDNHTDWCDRCGWRENKITDDEDDYTGEGEIEDLERDEDDSLSEEYESLDVYELMNDHPEAYRAWKDEFGEPDDGGIFRQAGDGSISVEPGDMPGVDEPRYWDSLRKRWR